MRHDELYLPLCSIPNVVGYKLIGVRRDGGQVELTVRLNAQNLHCIDGYQDLIGWKRVA